MGVDLVDPGHLPTRASSGGGRQEEGSRVTRGSLPLAFPRAAGASTRALNKEPGHPLTRVGPRTGCGEHVEGCGLCPAGRQTGAGGKMQNGDPGSCLATASPVPLLSDPCLPARRGTGVHCS